MQSLLWVGKVMYLSLSLEPKAIAIFIISLWMCWILRKLLFCWSLMCSGWPLAKSTMPTHSPPFLGAFLCPRLNTRTSWGCLWLPGGTWSFFCHPQSIVAFLLTSFLWLSHKSRLVGVLFSELSGLMTNEHYCLSGPLVNKEGSAISPFIFAFKWNFSGGSQRDLKTHQNKVFMIEYPGGDFFKMRVWTLMCSFKIISSLPCFQTKKPSWNLGPDPFYIPLTYIPFGWLCPICWNHHKVPLFLFTSHLKSAFSFTL